MMVLEQAHAPLFYILPNKWAKTARLLVYPYILWLDLLF